MTTAVARVRRVRGGGQAAPPAEAVRVAEGGGWLVATVALVDGCGEAGAAGLWKRVGGRARFEVPLEVMDPGRLDIAGEEEEQLSPRQAIEAWARQTVGGEAPAGWMAPTRAEVESIAPAEAWTVQVGSTLRQVRLVVGDERLALICPLAKLADGCGDMRCRWAVDVLADAQALLRMVRLTGPAEDGQMAAEIDLSGAPAMVARPLLAFALDAMRIAVKCVAPALALVADPRVGRVFDMI